MKLPWHNRTGIPKAIAILATIGILAFGLCTASFVTGAPGSGSKWPQAALLLFGITFIACMLAVGFLVDLYKFRSKRKR